MSELLFSVREVYANDGYLQNQCIDYYNIPLYQRGYKWKPKHVRKLLEDIDKFNYGDDKFYCLQNITIVPNDNVFNVVDGQQRLTTLTLLLHYLNEGELVKNKVKFPENSIRQETNTFLHELLDSPDFDITELDWSTFLKSHSDFDHQDIFHLFHAYKEIDRWFMLKQEKQGFYLDDYKEKLLQHVKFIVNKVVESTGEEKIFSNLNSKQIPLDGADLIRAALVTRVAIEESKRETDVKNIVMVNERRIKIGWVIDQMNNWWSEQNVANYFEKFVSIKSEETGGYSLFNRKKHPINLLYFLYAESEEQDKLTLEFIETKNNHATSLYKELLKLNNTLQDWYQDRKIYHLLGYLFNQTNSRSFKEVFGWWKQSGNRDEFILRLKKHIKNDYEDEDGELINFADLDENWYHNNTAKLVSTLVLLDVIHSMRENQPFVPFSGFSKKTNDIEHIFPQRPKEQKEKKAYVDFLNKYVVQIVTDRLDISEFDERKEEEEYIQSVDSFIEAQVKSIKTHSIGNLVLLYSSLNRSISNSSYGEKRSRVIEYFNQGNYIQPHTFHVFVRYFNDQKGENHDLEHWTNIDIEANAQKIDETITNFLNE